ncbi:DUF759 family protein, partial [Borreliella burgdorferi]
DLDSRITKMMEMFKDFKSFGLTKKANTAESIQSNLASAEQTLQNLTTTVLEPILDLIKKITNYFKDFTFQTHVVQPFFKGLKSLFAKLPVVGKFFRDNPEPVPNPPKPKPENNQNQDNANSTP